MAAAATNQYVTSRTYYANTYQDTETAKILTSGRDELGAFIITDKTIFHPQGGGQPSDSGTATFGGQVFKVIKLEEDGEAIKHYVEGEVKGDSAGQEVVLKIDLEARKLFARLHSAGHLLSDVTHSIFPELTGYRGNHFPGGQSFVVFHGPMPDKAKVKSELEAALNKLIHEGGPVVTDNGKERRVQMPGFDSIPCGGTHVNEIGKIGGIEIRSVKGDKGPNGQKELKVGYNVVLEAQ